MGCWSCGWQPIGTNLTVLGAVGDALALAAQQLWIFVVMSLPVTVPTRKDLGASLPDASGPEVALSTPMYSIAGVVEGT